MAERRMFAKSIVLSDDFLDLDHSTRSLYYSLCMLADDDGFVNNAKSVVRLVGATVADLDKLLEKRFVLGFDSGLIVIKAWKINNYIAKDRYHETQYKAEKASLTFNEKGAYTEMDTTCIQPCIQPVYNPYTEVSIGKLSLVKDSIITTTTTDAPSLTDVYLYFKENLDEGAKKEAEKFHAYNEAKGWSCLPHWKATADLWIARIDEKQGGHK